MTEFKCLNCGSTELSYVKWVKCQEKAIIRTDGHIEYCDQAIYDNDMLEAEHHYACTQCGKPPMFCDKRIMTESKLLEYLAMAVYERTVLEAEHEQMKDDAVLNADIASFAK